MMVFKGLITFVAALSATSVLAQSDQFNLRCKGTMRSVSTSGEKSERYETVYHVDLAQQKWCENACHAIYEIASVQPTQITFQDEAQDTLSEQSQTTNFVIRTTGKHHALSSARYRVMGLIVTITWDGQCEREDFTGFPAHETKF